MGGGTEGTCPHILLDTTHPRALTTVAEPPHTHHTRCQPQGTGRMRGVAVPPPRGQGTVPKVGLRSHQECDRSGNERLEGRELEEFCRRLLRRPELEELFGRYSGEDHVLSAEELRDFLRDQGEDASLHQARAVIRTYELNEKGMAEDGQLRSWVVVGWRDGSGRSQGRSWMAWGWGSAWWCHPHVVLQGLGECPHVPSLGWHLVSAVQHVALLVPVGCGTVGTGDMRVGMDSRWTFMSPG